MFVTSSWLSQNLQPLGNIIYYISFNLKQVIDQETTTSLITRDKVVRYDSQGWPEYQIRVVDLLKVLNIPIDNISKDILEKHIEILEDDGMGYA